jgi:hypothetical protein
MRAPQTEKQETDEMASDHLKDQFVAWFVIVMAGYYLFDYIQEKRKS